MTKPPHEKGRHAVESFARRWLDAASAHLQLGVTAAIEHRREDLIVTLTADGRGFGHRRPVQIASALQTLLEAALAREGFREGVEVRLDSAGSEAASAESHGLMAAVRAAALTAVDRSRAFALGPMSVADRRQVHQALGELGQVWTQSEGDGIFRRLWIVPRKMVAARTGVPVVARPDASGDASKP